MQDKKVHGGWGMDHLTLVASRNSESPLTFTVTIWRIATEQLEEQAPSLRLPAFARPTGLPST